LIGSNIVKREVVMRQIRISAELMPEEEGGYSVYCPELDIYTQGDTEEECLYNLREAAELHLEALGGNALVRQVIRREIEVRVNA
jgi:predicted RNase H-like HicB family nuclease